MPTRKERRLGMPPSQATKDQWAKDREASRLLSRLAHAAWVEWVDSLPDGDLKTQEMAWGRCQVFTAAEWGGGLHSADTYTSRIVC